MMRATLVVTALLLGSLVLPTRAQSRGDQSLTLENRFVTIEIDSASGAARSIRDKELNNTYAFSGIGFEVTTSTGPSDPSWRSTQT